MRYHSHTNYKQCVYFKKCCYYSLKNNDDTSVCCDVYTVVCCDVYTVVGQWCDSWWKGVVCGDLYTVVGQW